MNGDATLVTFVLTQDTQADGSARVDIWVEDGGRKLAPAHTGSALDLVGRGDARCG